MIFLKISKFFNFIENYGERMDFYKKRLRLDLIEGRETKTILFDN